MDLSRVSHVWRQSLKTGAADTLDIKAHKVKSNLNESCFSHDKC